MPLGNSIDGATAMSLVDGAGVTTELRMDPGILFWGENAARLVLAKDTLAAHPPRTLKLTINLPGDCAWYASPAEVPDEPGIEKWFPWQPKQDVIGDDSAIGMQKWLELRRAARRVVNHDGKLTTGDRLIRLWGINSNYGENYPEPKEARCAAWFAKYGINCVRLHKMAGSGFGFLGDSFQNQLPRIRSGDAGFAGPLYGRTKQAGHLLRLLTQLSVFDWAGRS